MATDKYRVLLVDDDPGLLRLLSMRLTAGITKRNRTEFYKLLQRHHLTPAQFKAAHPGSTVNNHA
jgi:hypothetical protein